ncbi:Ig-like domain-containing protein [Staphylococcus hyicus]|uniref:Ig-like domain-containing protein n=1 Tax=Staphylococcus hyicus TaxID=1284 RepID=UPI003736CD56
METLKYPFAKQSDYLKLNLQHFAQRAGDDEIMFGLADIIIGEGDDIIRFDGKNGDERSYLQVEGGSVTFEPEFEDIGFQDFGNGPYDQRVVAFNITVTIVAGQETIDMLKLAIGGTQDVTSGHEVTGVADSPLGASNRKRAKPMRIHPRFRKDHAADINIYKVASNSEVERAFGNEQGTLEMEFVAYPRDNADANKIGNYFYTGTTDPNGVLPTWDSLLKGGKSKNPSEDLEDESDLLEDTKVESITLKTDDNSIAPLETTTVTADVKPLGAKNKGVTFSTEDTQYATVDENTGVVTGVSEGVATITATAKDGSNVKGTIEITVQNSY